MPHIIEKALPKSAIYTDEYRTFRCFLFLLHPLASNDKTMHLLWRTSQFERACMAAVVSANHPAIARGQQNTVGHSYQPTRTNEQMEKKHA
jgi:hypothetical protein